MVAIISIGVEAAYTGVITILTIVLALINQQASIKNTVILNTKSNVLHATFHRGVLSRILHKVITLREQKKAVRALESLSDRLLCDIGINRSEIGQLVNRRRVFAPPTIDRSGRPDSSTELRKAAQIIILQGCSLSFCEPLPWRTWTNPPSRRYREAV